MEFILKAIETMSIEKTRGNKYAMFRHTEQALCNKRKVCVHTFTDNFMTSFETAKSYIASEFGYDSALYFEKHKKFEWIAK